MDFATRPASPQVPLKCGAISRWPIEEIFRAFLASSLKICTNSNLPWKTTTRSPFTNFSFRPGNDANNGALWEDRLRRLGFETNRAPRREIVRTSLRVWLADLSRMFYLPYSLTRMPLP